jgi:hypothetical protein
MTDTEEKLIAAIAEYGSHRRDEILEEINHPTRMPADTFTLWWWSALDGALPQAWPQLSFQSRLVAMFHASRDAQLNRNHREW